MPVTKDVFQRPFKAFVNFIKQNDMVASTDNIVATVPKGEIVIRVVVDVITAGAGTLTVKLGSTTLGTINTGTAGATVYQMCKAMTDDTNIALNPTNANIAVNVLVELVLPNGERVFV